GVHLGHGAEPHDDPRHHDDCQVGRVLLHARIAQRKDLIGRRGQAHDALAMQDTMLVEVTFRQRELDLSAERWAAGRHRDFLRYWTRSTALLASSSVSM